MRNPGLRWEIRLLGTVANRVGSVDLRLFYFVGISFHHHRVLARWLIGRRRESCKWPHVLHASSLFSKTV